MASFWQELNSLFTKVDIWVKKQFGGLQVQAVKQKQTATPQNQNIIKAVDFGTNTEVIRIGSKVKNPTVQNGYDNASKNFIGHNPANPVSQQETGIPTGFNQQVSTQRKKGVQ